jgi:hypothetical protein
LLAEELTETRGSDGSNRIIELLATCDVAFVGDIVAELGRPQTNVEQFIADPANDITPNQAQIDVLHDELSLYWRIAVTAAPQLATTVPTSVDATTPGGSDASTSSTPGAGSATTPGTGTTGTTAGDDDDSSGSGDDDGSSGSGSGADDGGSSGPG